MYKSREEAAQGAEPVHHINLRGCEVTPEVNIAQGRYGIKLEVPSAEGMTEMFIRCSTVSVLYHVEFTAELFKLEVSPVQYSLKLRRQTKLIKSS